MELNSGKVYVNGARVTGPVTLAAGLLWQVLAFVLLGFLVSLTAMVAIGYFGGDGGLIVFCLLVIGPPVVAYLVYALRQATGSFATLRKNLTWWHGVWLISLVSGLVFRKRTYSEITSGAIDSMAIFRISCAVIVGCILIASLGLRRNHWLQSLFRGLVGALTIYALICVTSSLWSVYPEWTLYKSCEYLVDVALLAAMLTTIQSVESYKTFFDWTWLLYGLLVVVAWAGALVDPKEALQSGYELGVIGVRLEGVFPHQSANTLGDLSAILAIVALSRLLPIAGRRSNVAWYILLFVAGLITLFLTQTRTAIAGLLCGAALIFFLTKRTKLLILLVVTGTLLLAFTDAGDMAWSYLQRKQSETALSTFSGRLIIWEAAWKKLSQYPFTGLGAYAGAQFEVMRKLGGSERGVGTIHSDYLEMISGTSLWGLIPMLIALGGTWWWLIRSVGDFSSSLLERRLALEALAVLALLSVRTVFMTIMVWHPPLHFFAVLGYAEFLRRRSRYG